MGAIRLFLALVVAIGHLQVSVFSPAGLGVPGYYTLGMNAGFAVMFFYMISGFLMSMVLTERYPATTAGTFSFYQSRFIRIYSLYWPTLLFMFFVYGFWGWFAALSAGDKFTNLFIVGMDWRIMFANYPDWHWDASAPFLHQAWTLGAELTFYIFAPFILRSWRIALSVLIAGAVLRGILVATTVFDGRWTYIFLPSTFMYFLIGHFSRVMSLRWTILKTGKYGALMLGLCLARLLTSTVNWDSSQFWFAVFCFAAALPGVFEATKRSALLNALGDLSYPIYLIHIMVVAEFVEWNMMDKLPRSVEVITLVYLAGVIVAGLLAHWLLERPTAIIMRWVVRRVSAETVAANYSH